MTELAQQVALITGASRGIGAAIALTLAQQGARVIGTATTAEGAERISEMLKPFSGQGRVLNVNAPETLDPFLKEITEAFGAAPTILVNNAAVTRDNLLLRMKESDWHDVIDTNLTSVFRLSKLCLSGMLKARKGRIVNISSIVGITGNPGQVNYSAAKAGLLGLTKSLALEVASRQITVNAVAPGFIDTHMTQVLNEQQKQLILDKVPLARLGEAQEIADAVSFLVSSKAAYITGQTLHVNGGMYMA